jgi:hypothetical protein
LSEKQIRINLEFGLNYGGDSTIIKTTNFHLPFMLYNKYKNFQRLRIMSEKEERSNPHPITSISNKLFKYDLDSPMPNERFNSDLDLVDFNISFKFNAEDPLSRYWVKQSNILMIESQIQHNHSLVRWLDDIIGVGKDPRYISLNIDKHGAPRILQGDFKKSILDSQESFLRDSYLKEKEVTIEFTFKSIDENGTIDVDIVASRTITSSRDVPVYGFFAFAGEKGLRSEMQIVSCRVGEDKDKLDPMNEVKIYPLTKILEYERSGNYGLYIPFKKPLIGSDKKEIEYRLHYQANIWEMDPISGFVNFRTKGEVGKVDITAIMDRKFVENYIYKVESFKGNIISNEGPRQIINPIENKNLFKYIFKGNNIKPNEFIGLIYSLKTNKNRGS